MSEYFYNFTFNGLNQGYSYLHVDRERLYSVTRFKANDKVVSNVFKLQLCDDNVVACKHGAANWVELGANNLDHFPDCAYPLLLPKARSHSYNYQQISAKNGLWIGAAKLTPIKNTILESVNNFSTRRFTMDGNTPVIIDWGGAVSHLCASAEESIQGAQIDFVI